MRWISRILLTIAFIVLATVAVLPHADTIRNEWHHLRETWEIVRSRAPSQLAPAVEPRNSPSKSDRGRTVLKPTSVDPTVIPKSAADNDPFLVEARRRAGAGAGTAPLLGDGGGGHGGGRARHMVGQCG